MIKLIFLDFDGVIVESVDIKTEAFARLFENEGIDVVSRVVTYHKQNTGVSRFDKFRYIYKEFLRRPLSDDEFKRLCDLFSQYVLEAVIAAPFVAGAYGFLVNCVHRYQCFVVSAIPQEEIALIVERRGLGNFFKGTYGSPMSKTEAVRRILNATGVRNTEALYIGDALSDYRAATDNTVRFIARINDNEFLFEGLDCLRIKDLRSLQGLIENL